MSFPQVIFPSAWNKIVVTDGRPTSYDPETDTFEFEHIFVACGTPKLLYAYEELNPEMVGLPEYTDPGNGVEASDPPKYYRKESKSRDFQESAKDEVYQVSSDQSFVPEEPDERTANYYLAQRRPGRSHASSGTIVQYDPVTGVPNYPDEYDPGLPPTPDLVVYSCPSNYCAGLFSKDPQPVVNNDSLTVTRTEITDLEDREQTIKWPAENFRVQKTFESLDPDGTVNWTYKEVTLSPPDSVETRYDLEISTLSDEDTEQDAIDRADPEPGGEVVVEGIDLSTGNKIAEWSKRSTRTWTIKKGKWGFVVPGLAVGISYEATLYLLKEEVPVFGVEPSREPEIVTETHQFTADAPVMAFGFDATTETTDEMIDEIVGTSYADFVGIGTGIALAERGFQLRFINLCVEAT